MVKKKYGCFKDNVLEAKEIEREDIEEGWINLLGGWGKLRDRK